MTDNKVRTVAEVRHIFSKRGGNMGTAGSVAYQFKKLGLIVFPADADEDRILEAALEAGAEDVVNEGERIAVYTAPSDLHSVVLALEAETWLQARMAGPVSGTLLGSQCPP